MNRKIPKVIRFPSIRFIHKGFEEQQGKKGIHELLLLLLRICLLLAIIVLFAMPFMEDKNTLIAGAIKEEVLIFCDVSASMTAQDDDYYSKAIGQIINDHQGATLVCY